MVLSVESEDAVEKMACCGGRDGNRGCCRRRHVSLRRFYDIGADTPHWPIIHQVMESTRTRAVLRQARDIQVPSNLNDTQVIAKGAGQYAAMCVNCHLAPGLESTEIRAGLYPQPPNLSTHQMDPRATFWVTKHGIKMSGMPAGTDP
jgi:hypothetical protein